MPAPEVGDAVDVDIHAYTFGAVPGGGEAEVGHFGAHAGERGEAGNCVGDVAMPLVAEEEGSLFDISACVGWLVSFLLHGG